MTALPDKSPANRRHQPPLALAVPSRSAGRFASQVGGVPQRRDFRAPLPGYEFIVDNFEDADSRFEATPASKSTALGFAALS